MIEFLCPNGHRIRCQAEQAGRPAKCPRCEVKFLVPAPNDLDVSEAVGSDSNVSRPDFTDSGVSSRKPPAKEPQIEFLCPNGHRLHGSPSLQGRPGECPECGSRFRIPTYDEMISSEEEAAQNIGLGRAEGSAEPEASIASPAAPATPTLPAPMVEESLSVPPPSKEQPPTEDIAMPTTISGRGVAGQSMAAVVARLWDMRPADATVELRLIDGETIVLHQFLKKLSNQAHQGVFAVSETDGSVSLTAIAWDAVARATLRGLKELPKDLVE